MNSIDLKCVFDSATIAVCAGTIQSLATYVRSPWTVACCRLIYVLFIFSTTAHSRGEIAKSPILYGC